jgi:hypothetical protein
MADRGGQPRFGAQARILGGSEQDADHNRAAEDHVGPAPDLRGGIRAQLTLKAVAVSEQGGHRG